MRCLLDSFVVLARHEVSEDVELLVLRLEITVLPRQIGRVRYRPGDRLVVRGTVAAGSPPPVG